MRFEKWEAVGNDFVLVTFSAGRAEWGEGWVTPHRIRAWCDRHRGVGADGVLVLDGLAEPLPAMTIFNADGSRAEMCGNGLRCAAAFVAERQGRERLELTFRTDAGERRCKVERIAPGAYEASVDMGVARLDGRLALDRAGRHIELQRVNVGNPHAVTFEADLQTRIDELGPSIDRSIDGGSNVEFCRILQDGQAIDLAVYERGVGPTLACGTGSCAAAAAAVAAGLCRPGVAIRVVLPGGVVSVRVEPTPATDAFAVTLRGPARRVFRGELGESA